MYINRCIAITLVQMVYLNISMLVEEYKPEEAMKILESEPTKISQFKGVSDRIDAILEDYGHDLDIFYFERKNLWVHVAVVDHFCDLLHIPVPTAAVKRFVWTICNEVDRTTDKKMVWIEKLETDVLTAFDEIASRTCPEDGGDLLNMLIKAAAEMKSLKMLRVLFGFEQDVMEASLLH